LSKRSKARLIKAKIREHARMAELLLPPTPENCPKYPRVYFESFRPKLFAACKNSRHRHCPKTVDQDRGRTHLYCHCPCHLPKMSRYKRQQLMLKMKQELTKKERKGVRLPRDPNAPRAEVGARGQQKRFRYVKEPDGKVPAGIMHIVWHAISTMQEGTVAEIATMAIEKGLRDVTGQDPTTQTSIMLHRMLKAGMVEVV